MKIIEYPDATTGIDFVNSAYFEMAKIERDFARSCQERSKAFYLGYSTVEQMNDHLPWLETRWPEGAEL